VQVCEAAASNGHLDALKFLHERGCPWDACVCTAAASKGHIEVLRYLHEHGCPWAVHTFEAAPYCGRVEVVRYLHEHGCPWTAHVLEIAAHCGNLEIVRYLHEHGCPWNGKVFESAVRGGNLAVLQYLYERGCPWNIESHLVMSCVCSDEVRDFLRDCGYPMCYINVTEMSTVRQHYGSMSVMPTVQQPSSTVGVRTATGQQCSRRSVGDNYCVRRSSNAMNAV
jgi:hypothetical protein